MPKDTLEQRLEAAKAQAIEEQARLQREERESGQKWKIALLEDRIEFAQRQAKSQWERELEDERSGRTRQTPERDPFFSEHIPSGQSNRANARDR